MVIWGGGEGGYYTGHIASADQEIKSVLINRDLFRLIIDAFSLVLATDFERDLLGTGGGQSCSEIC